MKAIIFSFGSIFMFVSPLSICLSSSLSNCNSCPETLPQALYLALHIEFLLLHQETEPCKWRVGPQGQGVSWITAPSVLCSNFQLPHRAPHSPKCQRTCVMVCDGEQPRANEELISWDSSCLLVTGEMDFVDPHSYPCRP